MVYDRCSAEGIYQAVNKDSVLIANILADITDGSDICCQGTGTDSSHQSQGDG